MSANRTLRALWIAVAVQVLGRLVDLRWHLTNDEFEGTAQQFEAHWLLWIGVLATLAVAGVGLRVLPSGSARGSWLALLVSAIAYVGIAIWHFVEHANGNDPGLAHLLLGTTQAAMIFAAILISVQARRGQIPAAAR